MITRFFTPEEVIDYFKRGSIKADLEQGNTIAICSIADLLNVCEVYKKGNLQISYNELIARSNEFNDSPTVASIIHLVDLDINNLSAALFEREDKTVDFWQQAINRNISPRSSIRYLTLRITGNETWWEDAYQDFKYYQDAQSE